VGNGAEATVTATPAIPVTFSVATSGKPTTTSLTLTFDQVITGLTAANIILTNETTVTKGVLYGSGTTYSLAVTTTAAGTVTVSVSPSSGYTSTNPETVNVAYAVPITITDQAGLANIATNLTANYALANDITVSGNWTPIGDGPNKFEGTLDGNGHTITLNSPAIQPVADEINYGLFGAIGTGAEIKNLKLDGTVSFTGDDTRFGPLVGWNGGTIRNVASSVNVTVEATDVEAYGGGIAGMNTGGLIENCYSTGNIAAANAVVVSGMTPDSIVAYAGGIAGQRYSGSIKNCWAEGTISAGVPNGANWGAAAGGITGYGTVDNCVALNSSVKATTNGNPTCNAGRVTSSSSIGTNNYANSAMTVEKTIAGITTTGNTNGTDVSLATAGTQAWWTGTAGWTINAAGAGSESSPWVWGTNRPKLYFE
jgi:hypothetical protein